MNTPKDLADLVINHGPQACFDVHKRLAVVQGLCQARFEHECNTLAAMASLAYRYGRKKAAQERRKYAKPASRRVHDIYTEKR